MEVNTENLATNREQWVSIDGYCNYEISWWGRVRNATTGRILKGSVCSKGYVSVGLRKNKKQKTHLIHQLVAREWIANPGERPCVDHIDGCKTNNHYENLRWATHSENSRNQKNRTNTSSAYKGVHFYKARQNWVSKINFDAKQKHLGYFETEREAAEAYNTAAVEHFGEFARLNTFAED